MLKWWVEASVLQGDCEYFRTCYWISCWPFLIPGPLDQLYYLEPKTPVYSSLLHKFRVGIRCSLRAKAPVGSWLPPVRSWETLKAPHGQNFPSLLPASGSRFQETLLFSSSLLHISTSLLVHGVSIISSKHWLHFIFSFHILSTLDTSLGKKLDENAHDLDQKLEYHIYNTILFLISINHNM